MPPEELDEALLRDMQMACEDIQMFAAAKGALKSRADHGSALKEIESLMAAKRDTPEGGRLDVLASLVEAYERKRFPMDA